MKTVETVSELKEILRAWREENLSIGFVPTMGFLHEGHTSLIERSAADNDKTVVSIFVNPMQFGPNEDLEAYPRDFETDKAMCMEAGADLIFYPSVKEIYPDGFHTYVDMGGLTQGLCGKSRPIHFRGVCTVVAKLFNYVPADRAYFGQKDAQQLAVIRQMARDLSFDIEIIGCPTVREPDGLAKSSRNSYLSPEERQAAVVVSKSVFEGKRMVESGERSARIVQAMTDIIQAEPLAKIDYVELVDLYTMEKVKEVNGPVLGAVAVYIGKTRLIDNFIWDSVSE